jgi:hypothetical protein
MRPNLTHSLTRHTAFAALALSLATLALTGCQEPEDHREVVLLVDDLSQALEDRDVRGLFGNTTSDFLLFPGRQDKNASMRRAFLMFKLHGAVEVLYPHPEIELDGDSSARVSGPFLLVRRGASDPTLEDLEDTPDAWVERASELGEVTDAELSLVRRGDRWLVQTARFF